MNIDDCISNYLVLSAAAFQLKRSKANIMGKLKDKVMAEGAYRSDCLADAIRKVAKLADGDEEATLASSDTTCRTYAAAHRCFAC